MPVSEIKIIKSGTITFDSFEEPTNQIRAFKKFCGVGGGSSVTYIRSDKKIIIDTGYDFEENRGKDNRQRNRKILIGALTAADITPEDVDIVFLTHGHFDHLLNFPVFSESEIVMSRVELEGHNSHFRAVNDNEGIADGVTVLATPGHTRGHCSLLCETDNLRHMTRSEMGGQIMGIGKLKVVVAGDAVITSSYFMQDKIWSYNPDFYSEEAARESQCKIQKIADFIIPGHGTIFKNIRKDNANITG